MFTDRIVDPHQVPLSEPLWQTGDHRPPMAMTCFLTGLLPGLVFPFLNGGQ